MPYDEADALLTFLVGGERTSEEKISQRPHAVSGVADTPINA